MASDDFSGALSKEMDIASASAPEIRGITSPRGDASTRHRSRSRNREPEPEPYDPYSNQYDPNSTKRLSQRSIRAGLLASDDPTPPDRPGRSLKRKPTKPIIDPLKSVSRTKTLLKRLGTIKTPKTPVSGWMSRSERYTPIDDPVDDEPLGVDISSLGGAGYQLHELPSPKQPPARRRASSAADRPQDDAGDDNFRGTLGDGMVVGAELHLDETPAVVNQDSAGTPMRTLTIAEQIRRRKTIRDQAQAVAQKKQVIVAVNEAVDLSSLEDSGRRNTNNTVRTNTTLDAIEQGSKAQTSQSYFYPEDPNHPDWKPFSMSSLYIIMLIVVTLTLAIIQEWLYQFANSKDRQHKGVLSFDRVADVSLIDFFAWKYMPTLIFVAYGVLWSIMDYEIKRLEPYYQLSRPGGAVASQSINLDHLTLWSYLVPFKAFRFKQWAVFFSAVGNLLATSVAASLQNPSVQFLQNKNCTEKCPEGEHRLYVSIDNVWSRLLTASLVITGVLGIILLFQLRRKSGLLSDPRGIAGIASMATKSHILQDFHGLDLATDREIHKRLRDRRYILYKSSIWQGEYSKKIDSYEPPPVKKTKIGRLVSDDPHPLMLRTKTGFVFVGTLLFFLIIVPVINFTGARAVPNSAGWLPVLIATLIKMIWTTFEFDVRLIEPFYILSKGDAHSDETLTLDYQGTPYGWLPLKALLNGHYIVALVGLGSILTDVLTVTVSSFSVNGNSFPSSDPSTKDKNNDNDQDETFKSFLTSVVLSTLILAYLISVASLVYLRRRHPFLPREPATIAAVLAFIHASNMLHDFVGTEQYDNRAMEEYLRGRKKKYGLGWFRGRDGELHCAIDEEPMRSRYVHGKPYTMAQAPWEGGGGGGMGTFLGV